MLTYPQAVKELYYALYGSNPSNFHAELYFLIGKADPFNRNRLRLAFPMEVRAWEEWQTSRNEREFFAQFGLGVPKPGSQNTGVERESASEQPIGSDDRD